MSLTIDQYSSQFAALDKQVAESVVMPVADGSQLILYDPDPAAVTGGVRDQLGAWNVLSSPVVVRDHVMLRRYAAALAQQIQGAARVSLEARLAAAEAGGPVFQSQPSLGTVLTTHEGVDLSTRVYEVTSPYLPSGAPAEQAALLSGFVPGAVVAGVIEGVRTVIDDAVASIDTITASLVS